MSKNGVQYLVEEFTRVVEHSRKEYENTFAEMLGVLEIIKHNVIMDYEEELLGNLSEEGEDGD